MPRTNEQKLHIRTSVKRISRKCRRQFGLGVQSPSWWALQINSVQKAQASPKIPPIFTPHKNTWWQYQRYFGYGVCVSPFSLTSGISFNVLFLPVGFSPFCATKIGLKLLQVHKTNNQIWKVASGSRRRKLCSWTWNLR